MENMRSPPHETTSHLGYMKNATHETTIYHSVDQADTSSTSYTSYPPNDISPIQRPHSSGGRGLFTRVFQDWWLEILAAVLVVVSFSGMVAVLHTYQGKPLPSWPLNFSLNTALSVFGAVFRAPVLFIAAEGIGQLKWQWFSRKRPLHDLSSYDSATRGPWGAAKLLWKARWRDGLAFLGAAIIVISFGIDPFTQAVVGYYDCNVPVNRTVSSVSHINSLFSQRLGNSLPTWARIATDQSLRDPTSIMPNFTCSTAQCNFTEPYHSIGLCSKCVDMADELITSCSPKAMYNGCNYTLSRGRSKQATNTTASYIWATSPGKRASNSTIVPTGARWEVFSVRKYGASHIYDETPSLLGQNSIVPSHQSSTFDIVSAKPILGCRCFVYYCMRSYTATIEADVLHEKLESTSSNWSNFTNDTPVLGTVKVGCLNTETQTQLLTDGRITKDTDWMPWDGTSANPPIPAHCIYQLQTVNSILDWDPAELFSDRFEGILNATGAPGTNTVGIGPTDSTLLAGLWDNGTVTVKKLDDAFQNFTTAATNYLRRFNSPILANISSFGVDYAISTLGPNNIAAPPETRNQPVEGQAFINTTCIRVRWPWLALPAGICVGTLVFLLGLILKMVRDHETEVWKSSPNALLWHGLAGEAEAESVVLSSKKQMEARARGLQVQLGMTKRGWKLVQE